MKEIVLNMQYRYFTKLEQIPQKLNISLRNLLLTNINISSDSEIPTYKMDTTVPTLFVLADDCATQTISECKKRNPLLGTYYVHELNEELFKIQWNQLWQYSKTDDFNVVNDISTHFWLHGEKLKALSPSAKNRH